MNLKNKGAPEISNTWKLNNSFVNNPWVKVEVSRNIKLSRIQMKLQYFKICEMLRTKFIALNAYTKKKK